MSEPEENVESAAKRQKIRGKEKKKRVSATSSARITTILQSSALPQPAVSSSSSQTGQPSILPARPQLLLTVDAIVKQTNMAAESLSAFALVGSALRIPFIGLRAGSEPPSGVHWKRLITVPKPRVYEHKSFTYDGPLGGFYPVQAVFGRRDPKTGKPATYDPRPLTQSYQYYNVNDFKTCLADVLEACEKGNCIIFKITDHYVFFENKQQNEHAKLVKERITYRFRIEDPGDSSSKREQILSSLVKRVTGEEQETSLRKHWRNYLQQTQIQTQRSLANISLFHFHALEGRVEPLAGDSKQEEASNGPQYQVIKVHSYENNYIGSDIDTFVIPTPHYLLTTHDDVVAQACRLFDSTDKAQQDELNNRVSALINFYRERREHFSVVVDLINETEACFKKNDGIINDSLDLAQFMQENIAYQDTPGIISPFELLYYSLVNRLNDDIMRGLFTESELLLTYTRSFNCVQHGADANFEPFEPKLLEKVGTPGKILFITPYQFSDPQFNDFLKKCTTKSIGADTKESMQIEEEKQPTILSTTLPIPLGELAEFHFAPDEQSVLSFLEDENRRKDVTVKLSSRYTRNSDKDIAGRWHLLLGNELRKRAKIEAIQQSEQKRELQLPLGQEQSITRSSSSSTKISDEPISSTDTPVLRSTRRKQT